MIFRFIPWHSVGSVVKILSLDPRNSPRNARNDTEQDGNYDCLFIQDKRLRHKFDGQNVAFGFGFFVGFAAVDEYGWELYGF